MPNLLYSLPYDVQLLISKHVRILYINGINSKFSLNYNKLKEDYNNKIFNYYTFSEFHNILLNIHDRINNNDEIKTKSQLNMQNWLISKWTRDKSPIIKNAKLFYYKQNKAFEILFNNIDNIDNINKNKYKL